MRWWRISYNFLGAFAMKLPIISQFSKIHGAVICSDLGTKIKLEHLAKMMLETEFVISVNKCVTNIRHQHQDIESIKVNLEQVVRLFWHLLSQWPHGQSAKNYEDHKRPIFHRHFQETIYKADRIFPSLNFKIFQKSSFFSTFFIKIENISGPP